MLYTILFLAISSGHIDYLYQIGSSLEGEDLERATNRRWLQIMHKSLNPMCRHLRNKVGTYFIGEYHLWTTLGLWRTVVFTCTCLSYPSRVEFHCPHPVSGGAAYDVACARARGFKTLTTFVRTWGIAHSLVRKTKRISVYNYIGLWRWFYNHMGHKPWFLRYHPCVILLVFLKHSKSCLVKFFSNPYISSFNSQNFFIYLSPEIDLSNITLFVAWDFSTLGQQYIHHQLYTHIHKCM